MSWVLNVRQKVLALWRYVSQNAQPQLTQAAAALDDVRQTRLSLPDAQLSPALMDWVSRFDQLLPLLDGALVGTRL